MENKDIVFDASIVIALINEEIKEEELINYLSYNIFMSTVNIGEVYKYIYAKFQQNDFEMQNYLAFNQLLKISHIDFTIEQSLISAELYLKTKQYGLSLGDRACLALAIEKNLPVLTCDRDWAKLDLGIDIILGR